MINNFLISPQKHVWSLFKDASDKYLERYEFVYQERTIKSEKCQLFCLLFFKR